MSHVRPVVLFACIHNSGRSVAAKVLTEHLAGEQVEVRSAGSNPSSEVNPLVALVLSERGLSVERERPTLLSERLVDAADVVVTMGCGESCPFVPGKRYEEWAVEDPAERDLDDVRHIVDDIEKRVRILLAELSIDLY